MLDPARVEQLRTEIGDDGLAQLVEIFCENTPVRLDQLRQACGTLDRKAIGNIAHSLKGSGASIGASEMAEVASELEATAQSSEPPAIEELVRRLETAFEPTRSALVAEVEGIGQSR
jgi:histidine phosphotransfer protein HptB